MSSPNSRLPTRIWTNSATNQEEEVSSTTVEATPSYIHAVFDKMMEEKNRQMSSYSSPTSVVTVPLTPPNVQSRIILDTLTEQQGTEVTLLEEGDARIIPRRCFADEAEEEEDEEEEEDILSIITPLQSPATKPPTTPSVREDIRSNVLSSPETPIKVPLCGMGNSCWKYTSALSPKKTPPVQEYILALLGNKNTAQCWRKHFSCYAPEASDDTEQETRMLQRNLLKRRPTQMKAQRQHLDDLRRNLQPFSASPKRVHLFRSISHQTVQSARKAQPRAPLEDLSANKSAKSSLWQAFACHQVVADNVLDETYHVEAAGYDSDPECFGRTSSVRSPPRADKEPTARRLFALDVMEDEDSLEDVAKSILNEKWTLILHELNKRPQAFHVWIERGQKLPRTLVGPKLAWKPLPRKGDRTGIKSVPTFSIDILDIQRILPLDEIDRTQYPLAKAGDSFLLKTISGTFCWQASSTMERDRLIALWKLTVARFGSMLVTGDDDGMEEYFAPFDAGVRFPHNN